MKVRHLTAVAAVVAVATAACSSSDPDEADSGPQTLTVWYMDGSLSDDTAAAVKKQFEADHKDVTVKYQVQTWDNIGEKLTTAMSSKSSPDVVEIGNTQVAQYASVGALADLTDSIGDFDNSDSWLPGLAEPGQWEDATFAIPFYAGDRTVIYRTDMFDKAGVEVPTSWDEFIALGDPLRKAHAGDKKFMPLYLPGQEWYTLASLVWDEGGDLAAQSGDSWEGTLSTPEAKAGMQRYQEMYDGLSKAPADIDEATPQQFEVMAQGSTAMMIGLAWEKGSVESTNSELADKLGVFALPSKTAGQPAPPFVGGSDLAVPAASDAQQLGTEFVQLVASTEIQTLLAEGGAIPNSAALADVASDNEVLQVQIAAAETGKVTPITPGWAAVETAPNPIKDMMTKVLTGTSIPDAAAEADKLITDRMAG
ncbi:MAG: extracellular solute-binding protein [Nocardioidaceae bacterium]